MSETGLPETPDSGLGLGVVVLAAGASTRMGRPKARVPWGGRTLLGACVDLARSCGPQSQLPLVVVGGAVDLREDAERLDVSYVHNEGWKRGPLSSLQCALGALALGVQPPRGGALVLTVDRPHLRPATIQALLRAHAQDPDKIWQPSHRARRGHPIIWPAAQCLALLALAPDSSPRALLGMPHVSRLRRTLEVDDPAVLHNLDRPEDLAHLPAPR